MAHLMFYTPLMDGAVWGADLPKSPVMLNPQFRGAPEPIDVFMVPAAGGRWDAGSARGHVGAGTCQNGRTSDRSSGMPIRSSRFSGWKRRSVQMYVASHELIIVLCA